MRYHIGSIAYGSFVRPFAATAAAILSPFAKMSAKLKEDSPRYKKYIAKTCFCSKWYFSKLRYLAKQNYIFVISTQLAIFGESFFDSGVQALHLMRRNYVRIGRPCKIGDFVISIIEFLIILAGPVLNCSLILFSSRTMTGQLTIELSSLIGPVVFNVIISWFVGRIFAGALRVSLNTVLISAACDEEMFAGEQRFIEQELLDFMDGIGEEQNQHHRENKLKVMIEGGYNGGSDYIVYKKSDSYRPYMTRVLPSREKWGEEQRSHVSGNTSNSRLFTPNLNVYPPQPSENHSFMGDIKEESLEDDMPSMYSVGTPARYVND